MGSSNLTAQQKFVSAALFLFAFVGFIASIVAVVSYFQPRDEGLLRVEITPNDFQIPLELATPFAMGEPTRQMLANLKDEACKTPAASKPVLPLKSAPSSTLCDQITDVEWLGRWVNAFAASPSTLYYYRIENRGSSVAQQVRVFSRGIASIQLRRGSDFADLPGSEGQDYYSIPDLNPHETAHLMVWMTSKSGNLPDYADAPKVTFSGAGVQTTIQRQVPERWYQIYDIFGTIPWWMLAIVIVGISVFITLAIALIIAVIETIIKGRPLKSIFEVGDKTKVDIEATSS